MKLNQQTITFQRNNLSNGGSDGFTGEFQQIFKERNNFSFLKSLPGYKAEGKLTNSFIETKPGKDIAIKENYRQISKKMQRSTQHQNIDSKNVYRNDIPQSSEI